MPLRLFPLAAVLLAASLTACDTGDVDDTALDVLVVDLLFDADDYVLEGVNTASFSAADAAVLEGDLSAALQTAGQGDLVMAYISSDLVSEFETNPDAQFWTPLPLTRGFDELVLADRGGETVEVPVTGYVASYEYSFADDAFFFEAVSSAPYTDFTTETEDDPRVLFDAILPRRFGSTLPDDIEVRLVVIPDELFFTTAADVDFRSYESVQKAYGLPD